MSNPNRTLGKGRGFKSHRPHLTMGVMNPYIHVFITLIALISTQALVWVRGKSRKTESSHTARGYTESVKRFDEFCQLIFGHSIDKEIDLMKSEERRVYGTLSSFVDWMEARQLFPHTMQNYMAGVKSYLGFQWVDIKPTYFRESDYSNGSHNPRRTP